MISRGFMTDSEKRKRQIDTLKIFNENVVEVSENDEYRVDFKSAGRNMSVTVRLGPSFPSDRPILFVAPLVCHSWVHQSTGEVIDAPGLINFTIHSDLGRVVQAIIREIERNPPQILNELPDKSKFLGPNSTCADLIGSVEASVINTLTNLSTAELNALQDPDCLDEYLQSLPQVQNKRAELEALMQEVENLALETISKQSALDSIKADLNHKVDIISQLRSSYEALNDHHQQMAEQYSPQNIRELLQQAAVDSDEACEAITEKFLNGQLHVERFLHEYTAARKLSQARKAKEERLASQLNALQRAGF